MAKLGEIGVEEMREHLRAAYAGRSRESFFEQALGKDLEFVDTQVVHDMQDQLREACVPGPQDRLLQWFLRRFRDPNRPTSERGRLRLHPLLLLWGGTALLAVGVFLYLSFA